MRFRDRRVQEGAPRCRGAPCLPLLCSLILAVCVNRQSEWLLVEVAQGRQQRMQSALCLRLEPCVTRLLSRASNSTRECVQQRSDSNQCGSTRVGAR